MMVVRVFIWMLAGLLLSGCAGVKVVEMGASDYMSLRRGDILSSGKLSTFTRSSLQVVGIDDSVCVRDSATCRNALMTIGVMDDEQRLSALSELWLQTALGLAKGLAGKSDWRREEALLAYVESARYAYAYLFMTDRKPAMRALEDRQTQVRDYYNFSVQRFVTEMFELHRNDIVAGLDTNGNFRLPLGPWMLNGYIDQGQAGAGKGVPQELVPAASLTFKGMRNMYRRDGIGAELVAVRSRRVVHQHSADVAWSETPFPAVTMVMHFAGRTLDEVLQASEMTITGYDPYRRVNVHLQGVDMPLAANFTSAYGLWLARSGFASQALLTLVGRGEVLERPHVYLMQPYDPNRRIIIMLHGLASSPEAWINVANEVLGDDTLRQYYQIWQVYYPTNMPMVVNHYAIQKAIEETLAYVDPTGTAQASRDIVLIGHSMGGVLSRLMVSSDKNRMWQNVERKFGLDAQRLSRLKEKMGPYGEFRSLPGVDRAIFIATPHRGTPIAENRFARWIAGLITLPVSLVTRFRDMAQLVVDPGSARHTSLTAPLSSIGSLSDKDPFMQLTYDLPISPDVRYHSIIGNNTPNVPLDQSDDGVVPYLSAHLPGADSEKVIASWHSVQETPEAIVEIRRILHLHLLEHPLR